MHVLLETHVAQWTVVASKKLAARAKDAFLSADEVFVGTAFIV